MLGTLGQHRYLAALSEGMFDFNGNCDRSDLVVVEVSDHDLSANLPPTVRLQIHGTKNYHQPARPEFCRQIYRQIPANVFGPMPQQEAELPLQLMRLNRALCLVHHVSRIVDRDQ
ncbi:MAG TPA: hypothetical protein VLJ19_15180 [Variovorax sp.]|nr:hypothetical protein [Variovorax sp.]